MTDPFIDACVKHDKALRARVKLLGQLLGDVIASQSGGEVLRTVERLRRGFIQLRERPDPDRLHRLKNAVRKLSPDALRPVIRAFSIYFQLANAAEESFQQHEVLGLVLVDVAVRHDHGADGVEEELTVFAGDVRRVHLFGAGRDLQPLLHHAAVGVVELQLLDQAAHEVALLVLHLEVGPRERADELHQAEALFTIQVG